MNNTTDLKKNNLLKIIAAVYWNETMAKPEIGHAVGVTQATAHNFTNELVDRGLFQENGSAKSSGGRRAALYKLNTRFGVIVSQSIEVDGLHTGLYDIALNPLYQQFVATSTEYSEHFVDLMAEEAITALERAPKGTQHCLGMGIIVPGRVDPETGIIRSFVNIKGWKNIPLKSYMEGRLKIPVSINNDNSTFALAARHMGEVSEDDNTVFLSITTGVGVGVYINNQVLQGSHWMAGELGHTTIDFNGPMCKCGNRGCIETFIGYPAIIEQVQAAGGHPEVKDIDQVIALISAGDAPVMSVMEKCCRYVCITLDHIVKSYDPDVILVSCKWLASSTLLFQQVLDHLFTDNPFIRRDRIKILINPCPDLEYVAPAALVMDSLLKDMESNRLLEVLSV